MILDVLPVVVVGEKMTISSKARVSVHLAEVPDKLEERLAVVLICQTLSIVILTVIFYLRV